MQTDPIRFVFQQHSRPRTHFDFRIELGGVARSWAVPRGPSLDPRERRLALPVADHGLGSLSFEGVHPGGGGAVIVWDAGSYRTLDDEGAEAALDAGHAKLWLDGEKLSGGFALTRTAISPKPQWLLVKMRDEHARDGSDVVAELPRSVISARTLVELSPS